MADDTLSSAAGGRLLGTQKVQSAVDGFAADLTSLRSAIQRALGSISGAGGVGGKGSLASDVWNGSSNWGGWGSGKNGGGARFTGRDGYTAPANHPALTWPYQGMPPRSPYEATVLGGTDAVPAMSGASGGNGGSPPFTGGSQTGGKGNGGHASRNFGIGATVAGLSQWGNSQLIGQVSMDAYSANTASGLSGNYGQNRTNVRTAAFGGTGGWSNYSLAGIGMGYQDVAQGAFTRDFAAGAVGPSSANWRTVSGAQRSMGYLDPSLGAAGAGQAAADMYSANAFYGAMSMGYTSPIGRGGRMTPLTSMMQNQMQRNFQGRSVVSTQAMNAALGQNGYLNASINARAQASGWSDNTTAAYKNSLRITNQALNRPGANEGQLSSLLNTAGGSGSSARNAQTLLQSKYGIGRADQQSLKNTQAASMGLDSDKANAYGAGLQTTNTYLSDIRDALRNIEKSVGANGAIGGAGGALAGLGGSVGNGIGAYGAFRGLGMLGRAAKTTGIAGKLGMGGRAAAGAGDAASMTEGGAIAGSGGGLAAVAAPAAVAAFAADVGYGAIRGAADRGLSHRLATGAARRHKKNNSYIESSAHFMAGWIPGVGKYIDRGSGYTYDYAAGGAQGSGVGGGAVSGGGVTGGGTGVAAGNNGATGAQVVADAEKYVGMPYHWGGNNPKSSFDCSGLMQYAYKQVGVNLPRTSSQQSKVGKPVDKTKLSLGDLLFYHYGGAGIDHVAMYAGGGKQVAAPTTGEKVQVQGVDWSHFVEARRVLGSAGTMTDGSGNPNAASMGDSGGSGWNQATGSGGLYGSTDELDAVMAGLSGGGTGSPSGGSSGGSNAPASGTGGSSSASVSSLPTSAAANRLLGQKMAAARGWTGSEWTDLNNLVMRESGWKNTAQNPTSTAFGIFQFLNSTWGGHAKTSDAKSQIQYGLEYIAERYKDPAGAWKHEQQSHWYDKGAWQIGSDENARVHKDEMIIPANQANTIRNALMTSNTPVGRGTGSGPIEINVTVSPTPGMNISNSAAVSFGRQIANEIASDTRIKKLAVGN